MAKVSVISDLHLGFKKGTQREDDAFIAAERAFRKAVELDSDIILLAGDIFDSRFPRPEHWSRFMELLKIFQDGREVEVGRTKNIDEVPESSSKGTPVVAIHGTHERRGEGLVNPIQALKRAGFLTHLHCSSIELKVGGEKIGVHGMSGVPEKYSKKVLKKWNPEPFDGAYNIFMLHQDIEPYIFNPANPPSLGLEDLPDGFDCYASGHIHWRERTELRGKPFIIPGSLVPTQLKKKEAEVEKGFYLIDTEEDEIDFVEVEPPRKFFYEEVEIEGESIRDIEVSVDERLAELLSSDFEERPIVRVVVKGELPEGVNPNDLNLGSLRPKYKQKAIVKIANKLEEAGAEEKIQMLRDVRNEELSVDEMGMKMLRNQLEEMDSKIKPGNIFDDLVEGNVEGVMNRLLENWDETESEVREEEREGEVEEGKQDEEKGNTQRSEEQEWWK